MFYKQYKCQKLDFNANWKIANQVVNINQLRSTKAPIVEQRQYIKTVLKFHIHYLYSVWLWKNNIFDTNSLIDHISWQLQGGVIIHKWIF